jgi:hypothetical protein
MAENTNLAKFTVEGMQNITCPARFKFIVLDKETKEVYVPYFSEMHFLSAVYEGAKFISWKENDVEQVCMLESEWYIQFLKDDCEDSRLAKRIKTMTEKVRNMDFIKEVVEEVKAELEV